MARRDGLVASVGVLALALAVVSGCSGDDAPAAPERTSADARADLTIVPKDALPDGWVRVPARERLQGDPGKPRYCGVSAEPRGVVEGRVSYYEQQGLPRSVLEYGMVATESSATATLDELLAVRDMCQEEGLEVEPVPADEIAGIGDQQVAWDFDDGAGTRFRTLVVRRGEVVVALVATGDTSVPTAEQLELARTIDDRLG
jgi:hypothetical protein